MSMVSNPYFTTAKHNLKRILNQRKNNIFLDNGWNHNNIASEKHCPAIPIFRTSSIQKFNITTTCERKLR